MLLHEDEEAMKEDEIMESNRFKVFAKVLLNIQTTCLNQLSKIQDNIEALINNMHNDIKIIRGTSIQEKGI